MKLSRKKAIELCIELWTWLAETGEEYKNRWPKWGEYHKLYGGVLHDCWFCQYNKRQFERYEIESTFEKRCKYCPYDNNFGAGSYACEEFESPYDSWLETDTPSARKKYAKLFLEQIKSIERKR